MAGAPQISIARVRGSLLDGLRLEGVRMRTARDELDIDVLALEWNGPALLTGVLAFTRADAGRATYRRVPGVTAAAAARPSCRGCCASRKEASRRCRSRSWSARWFSRRRPLRAPTAAAGSQLTDVAGTFGDAALAADATFELEDGIELDVAGEWSGPLAGVAASGSVELTGHLAQPYDSSRARDAVRGDDDGHARGRAVPRRPRQRVAEPRVAGRRRRREPERPARARRVVGRVSL